MSAASPDAQAAAAALREWRRPVWAEAGAGTGKTTILVARIVAWALDPGWERHAARMADDAGAERVAAAVLSGVVAITFTEAAAAEMAVRVGAALRAVATEEEVPLLEVASLPEPETRRMRARALLACLDQLPVQTIHAFCRRVLAGHALDAGLHPRFQVDADERALYAVAREIVEAALQEAYAREESDALALAAEAIGPPDLEEALRFLVQAGVPAQALAEDPLAPEAVERFVAELVEGIDAFAGAEASVLSGNRRRPAVQRTAQRLAETAALLRRAGPADPAALASEVAALWEDGNERKRLAAWANDGFKGEGEDLGNARPQVAAACAEIAPRLQLLFGLDPERLRRTRRLLAPLVEAAEGELRRRGWITYGGLLRETRDLLARRPAVRDALAGSIDQLLVDEFQDTDGIQCEIVRALALTGPEDRRPGLFVVGDPKQSIYGWRSADLRAYHAFTEELARAGGVGGELVVNRRSVEAILREVERTVAPVMRHEPGLQPAFQSLACGRREAPGPRSPHAASVEHWVSWPWDEEQDAPPEKVRAVEANRLEARSVARDLRRLHDEEAVAWSRFALLFRSTGQLDVYLSELRDAGIPYVVERDRTFYERREIIDAIALVRAVLDRHDQVALVAALRSAAVGVPDAALLPLWRQGLPAHLARLPGRGAEDREAARRAVRAAAERLPGDVPGLERLVGWERSLLAFVDALASLREAFDREPPERFVEALRTTLLLEPLEAARGLGPWRLANLDRLFRDLVRALEESAGDVSAVLGALRGAVSDRHEDEEGRPRDAAADAVHVGTIHKAKGLAFDHVYLCQVHKGKGGAGRRHHAVAHRGQEVALQLFGQPDLRFPALAAEGEAVEEAERVRTLYVALTRARDRLVVAGLRAGRRNGSHADLLRATDPPAEVLAAWMREAREAGVAHRDEDGVRWVFPALRESALAEPRPASRAEVDAASLLERLERDEAHLARRRRRADGLAARPFHRTASEGHGALAEARALRADADPAAAETAETADGADGVDGAGGEGTPPSSREEAMAAGQAVHAALEEAPLDAPDHEPFAHALRSSLAQALPDEAEEPARRRASAVLERFLAGPLAARLRSLGPHVVARELPVLLPPATGGEGEPVGFWSGAVDLLYRDPSSGALVVADYKTDAVAGEALRERARVYAAQGRMYARAVQEALRLPEPPRVELWFLHAGEVRVAPAEAARPSGPTEGSGRGAGAG